jgi:tetratricopeptide (TPR) repeat protein
VANQNETWVALTHKSYKAALKGEYQQSIYLAAKALELNPRASEAWRLIGNAYEFLGDEMEEAREYGQAAEYHRKATEAWDEAKKINPGIKIPGYHE